MKCDNVASTLASLTFLALYQTIFPAIRSWLPSTVSIEADTCPVTQREPGPTEMKCNGTVIIFTDFKPGDLWSIAVLFRQANSLHCDLERDEYPIRAIFGGGGYNSYMSRKALVGYISILKLERIVPAIFQTSSIFSGPTDLEAASLKEREWGWDFYQPDPRAYPPLDPLQDTLSSAFAGLEAFQRVLTELTLRPSEGSPIIVAMRPIFEFTICWLRVFQLSLEENADWIPLTDDYSRQVAALNWDKDKHQSVLDALARSHVIISAPYNETLGLGGFLDKMVVLGAVPDMHKELAINIVFQGIPQKLLYVDRRVILRRNANDRDRSNLFTAFSQRQVYERFERTSWRAGRLLRGLVRNHTGQENDHTISLLTSKINLLNSNYPRFQANFDISKSIGQRLAGTRQEDGFRHHPVVMESKRMQYQTFQQATHTQMATVRAWLQLASMPEAYIKENLDYLELWSSIVPFNRSYINSQDVLLPLLLDRDNNAVKTSMGPVKWTGLDENGVPRWERDNSPAFAQMWATQFASDAAAVEVRRTALRRDIGDVYWGVFDRG